VRQSPQAGGRKGRVCRLKAARCRAVRTWLNASAASEPVLNRQTGAEIPGFQFFRCDQAKLGEFLIKADLPASLDMIGNDHLMFAGERIDADQGHGDGIEAEFFPDLARDASRRILVAFEKTGDQAESPRRPGVVARQDDPSIVFDKRSQYRRRIVPVGTLSKNLTFSPPWRKNRCLTCCSR